MSEPHEQPPYGEPRTPSYGEPPPVPYGDPQAVAAPGPDTVDRLEEPPRPVPASVHLGVLAFHLWESFAVLMVLVTPMALWIFFPVLFAPVAVLVIGASLVLRWRRDRLRVRLLRLGRVAQVGDADAIARTARQTSTSYTNIPLPQARGWALTSDHYTGTAILSTIDFTVDGRPGTVRLKGRPYAGGVVLADPTDPMVALELSQFPFRVRPDPAGRLSVSFSVGQTLGMVFTAVAYGGVLVAAGIVALVVVG